MIGESRNWFWLLRLCFRRWDKDLLLLLAKRSLATAWLREPVWNYLQGGIIFACSLEMQKCPTRALALSHQGLNWTAPCLFLSLGMEITISLCMPYGGGTASWQAWFIVYCPARLCSIITNQSTVKNQTAWIFRLPSTKEVECFLQLGPIMWNAWW